MLAGKLETLTPPRNPLDVLAQQTVAAVAMDALNVDDWYATVCRAAPWKALPRDVFDATLDMLAGRYPSGDFSAFRPRIIWQRESGQLTARPGAHLLAVTSGGTIPDRGMFSVLLPEGEEQPGARRVGELDEEMVYESRVNDIITLGATSWRIQQITHDQVIVTPAPVAPPGCRSGAAKGTGVPPNSAN
jgi:ATP-dependent Lhr-like helicase